MAPTLISTTKASTLVITVPSGVQNGDLLVAFCAARNGTLTVFNGWTRIRHSQGTSGEWDDIFVRIANNEPASYTFTGTGDWVNIATAWRGIASPYYRQSWQPQTPVVLSVDAHAGGITMGYCTNRLSGTGGPDILGMTFVDRQMKSGDVTVGVFYKLITEDGPTGDFAASYNASYDAYGQISWDGANSVPIGALSNASRFVGQGVF